MPRVREGAALKKSGLQCGECGWTPPEDAGWQQNDTVYHCSGGTGADRYQNEIHHLGSMLYPLCWRCGWVVGCPKCCGTVTGVVCKKCAVWVTIAAFLEHGPIVNTEEMLLRRHGRVAPQFDEYPDEFRRRYLEAYGDQPAAVNPSAKFADLVR